MNEQVVRTNVPDEPGVPASAASDGSDKAAIQSAFETYKKSVDAMTEFLNNNPPDDSPFWDQMVESDKRWNESIRRIQDEAPWLAGISILPPAPQGSREFVRETYRALLRDLRGKEAEFRRLERIYAAIHQVAGKQVLLDVLRLDFRLGLREAGPCASPSAGPNVPNEPGRQIDLPSEPGPAAASVPSDCSADGFEFIAGDSEGITPPVVIRAADVIAVRKSGSGYATVLLRCGEWVCVGITFLEAAKRFLGVMVPETPPVRT